MLTIGIIIVFFMAGAAPFPSAHAKNIIPQTCQHDYKQFMRAKKCYKYYYQLDTWFGARSVCQHHQSDLMTLQDAETNTFMKNYLYYSKLRSHWVWMGLIEVKDGSHYKWLDGNPMVYDRWTGGQPSNDDINRMDCGEFVGSLWNDNQCSRRRFFVCEMPFRVFPVCPRDYVTYTKDSKCVKPIHDRALTWDGARTVCRNDGGDLAIASDVFAYTEFVKSIWPLNAGTNVSWVGMKYASEARDFTWLDGRPLNYSQWGPGEPDHDTIGYCGGVKPVSEGVGWREKPCNATKGFICEQSFYKPPLCPGHEWILNVANGKCYKVQTEEKSFGGSRSLCQHDGGDLVTITDPDTRDYVIRLVDPTIDSIPRYWIGLRDPDKQGNRPFQWLDGTSLNVSESNFNNNGFCGALDFRNQRYVYNDKNCHFRNPSICQKSSAKDYPVLECPSGYTTYISHSSDQRISCVKFKVDIRRAWSEAKEDCAEMDGELFGFEGSDTGLKWFVNRKMMADSINEYWSNPNRCEVVHSISSLMESECATPHHYVCLYWGDFKIMANLTDLGILLEENGNSSLHSGMDQKSPLTEVCRASSVQELYRLLRWNRTLSHRASIVTDLELTHSLIQTHKMQCLSPIGLNDACAEVTLRKPVYLSKPSEIEINLRMDKLFLLCPPDVPPIPIRTPIPQETFDFLANITTPTNGSNPPNKLCPCRCQSANIDFNPSPEALTQMLSKIQKELKVETEKLSFKRNKKISAQDRRNESCMMGYAAIAICLFPVCLLVFIDLSRLFQPNNN